MIKILKMGEVAAEEIFARTENTVNVEAIVAEIIANVRKNGDKALLEYCEKFDKAKLDSLLVTQEEIDEAVAAVAPRFLQILQKANWKRPPQRLPSSTIRRVLSSARRSFPWIGQACMCPAVPRPILPRC